MHRYDFRFSHSLKLTCRYIDDLIVDRALYRDRSEFNIKFHASQIWKAFRENLKLWISS